MNKVMEGKEFDTCGDFQKQSHTLEFCTIAFLKQTEKKYSIELSTTM